MASDKDPDEISTEFTGTDGQNSGTPPVVRDHTMIKLIGRGGYGDVWLARNIVGTYRAVKVVYRASFDKSRPFDREFEGIQNFEPVSRSHDGLVDLLQVGRNEEEDYFYYVMELGDDVEKAQEIDPGTYVPKTLETERKKRGRLPVDECLNIGLDLTDALQHLHAHGLIHRDLKPSNIIFVNGVPKVADIGLVVSVDATMSEVGTPGYIPLEGPGTVQADVFGLGKVLYEISTGRDRTEYPELPLDLDDLEDPEDFFEFNRIVNKACNNRAAERFRSAEDFHEMLKYRLAGGSIQRVERLESVVAILKKAGVVAAIAGAVGAYAYFNVYQNEQMSRRNLVQSMIRQGNQLIDSGDNIRALPLFVEALRYDLGDEEREISDRLRIHALLRQLPRLEQMHFLGSANRASLGPDGRFVASVNNDGEISLADLVEKTNAVAWAKVSDVLECVEFLPGSSQVIAGGEKGVYIFDLVTGRQAPSQLGPAEMIYDIDVDEAHRRIAFAHFDPEYQRSDGGSGRSRVTVWDLDSEKMIREIASDAVLFMTVDFSPDGERIAVGGRNGQARIYRVADSTPVGEPVQHNTWVYAAEFSPDGKVLVSSDYYGTILSSDGLTGETLRAPAAVIGAVRTVSFDTDGEKFATAGWNYEARVWNKNDLQTVIKLTHPRKHLVMARFLPGSQKLVTVTISGEVRCWDLSLINKGITSDRSFVSGDGVTTVALTVGSLRITRSDGEQIPLATPPGLDVLSLSMSADGRRLAVVLGHQDNLEGGGQLFTADLDAARTKLEEIQAVAAIRGVTISDAGDYGCAWSDTTVHVFRCDDRSIQWSETLKHPVRFALLGPANGIVAIGTGRDVQLRRIDNGGVSHTLHHPEQDVFHASFSEDGRHIATATSDGSLNPGYARVWDVATGEPIGKRMIHEDGVRHVSFSPDGSKIVTASEDNTARIWDAQTGEMLLAPLQHKNEVTEARFSNDGRWVATACRDQTARIWDAATGEALTPPLDHGWEFDHVRFIKAGQTGIKFVTRRTLKHGGETVLWTVQPDRNPVDSLVLYAKILSGHHRDANGGIIPESTSELRTAWEDYNANHREGFQFQ